MKKISVFFLFGLLSLFSVTSVFGESIVVATGHSYAKPRTNHILWERNTEIYLPVKQSNSYYCRGIGANYTNIFDFSVPSQNLTLFNFRSLNPLSSLYDKSAFAFVPAATLTTLAVTVNVNRYNSANDTYGSIECEETTMYGSFNTVVAANPVNFLEVINLDSPSNSQFINDVPIALVVHIKNYTGAAINTFQFSLAPGERRDVGIHDIAGASDTFGTIIINHNGAPGSLRANLSKYTIEGNQLRITATEAVKPK